MAAESHLHLERLLARRASFLPRYEKLGCDQSGAISFLGGLVDSYSFPINAFIGVAQRVMQQEGREALQYADPLGDLGLRELLVRQAKVEEGLRLAPENVVITHGNLAALGMICLAFLEPGDLVVVESPTNVEALRLFRLYEVELVAAPLDDQGVRVNALAQILVRLKLDGQKPKILYTMPTFHDPTGLTMTSERRQALIRLAHEFGFLVVEDDTYRDLRYEGEKIPSLFATDRSGFVLKTGTYSKILAPGLRLGWILGPAEIIAHLAQVRIDGGAPHYVARLVAEYAREGLLERHVADLIRIYRNKRDTLLAALAEFCPSDLEWSRPAGGFFVWVDLPATIDPLQLFAAAQSEGVVYLPGEYCFADGTVDSHIRLSFSHLSSAEITEGIKRLGRAMRKASR
jgi:2-aminoadipate transaminase